MQAYPTRIPLNPLFPMKYPPQTDCLHYETQVRYDAFGTHFPHEKQPWQRDIPYLTIGISIISHSSWIFTPELYRRKHPVRTAQGTYFARTTFGPRSSLHDSHPGQGMASIVYGKHLYR